MTTPNATDAGLAAYRQGDFASAAAAFLPMAQAGHPMAQFFLGYMHRKGEGVPQDDRESVAWYSKAARQGVPVAQNNLGFMYEHGHGVEQSYDMAETCFRRAAAAGDREAAAAVQALDALHALKGDIHGLGQGDASILTMTVQRGDCSVTTMEGTPNDRLWSRFCALGWAHDCPIPEDMKVVPGLHLRLFELTESGLATLRRFLPFIAAKPPRPDLV